MNVVCQLDAYVVQIWMLCIYVITAVVFVDSVMLRMHNTIVTL